MSSERSAVAELLGKLLTDPETAVLFEPAAEGGWIVVVDTSWVKVTDEEKALLEELRGDA